MEVSLPEQLRIWRTRRNLSQDELAEKAGVSRNSISMMERGTYNPTVDQWNKIAHALELEVRITLKPYEDFEDVEQGNSCMICGRERELHIWVDTAITGGQMHGVCESCVAAARKELER